MRLLLILLWTSRLALCRKQEEFEIASPLQELAKRTNKGCVRTCPASGDGMDIWGNWQGCTSSYAPGSGEQILTNQDLYSHNRGGIVWKHDKCWTNVVSAVGTFAKCS